MELRDYQIECVDSINNMSGMDRKICYISTGGGKTVCMASIAKYTSGRVLIVVDQKELRQQTIDKLRLVCGKDESIGSVQGVLNEINKRIIIATRQSLTHINSNRINQLKQHGKFDVIMIDECHRACGQVKTIIDNLADNCKVIGFTATPYNPELKNIFDGFVYKKEIMELIDEEYLCSPRCFRIDSDTDLTGVKTVGGEFIQSELSNRVNNVARNNMIVKAYIDKAIDRKRTIVFATSIDHATSLAKCFNDNGIDARSIDSTLDSNEREGTLDDFKKGKFKVLVNVAILTTGFDMPELDCIIMARPTKSKILYVQCLGRGLRIFEGKRDCLVLDIVDNASKHSLINMKSIFDTNDGEDVIEANIRKKNEEDRLLEIEEELKRIEEENERLRLEEIEMFNSNIFNIRNYSMLDWYFTYINDNKVAILSVNSTVDYYICKIDEKFNTFRFEKKSRYDNELELIESSSNLMELVSEVDAVAYKNGNNFTNKYAKWKADKATDKQVKYAKGAKTKWDVNKYFSKNSCYFALKDILKNK